MIELKSNTDYELPRMELDESIWITAGKIDICITHQKNAVTVDLYRQINTYSPPLSTAKAIYD